jgi:flagellar basal-body rod protein FlgF
MDGIELMASAMQAMRERLDVAAGNLANASSDGFRRRVAHSTLSQRGVVTTSSAEVRQGPLRHTGRALDVAVAGDGGFLVSTGGKRSAIRSASLERNASGYLCDGAGRLVVGERGPIQASADATIDDRGVVRDDGAIRGHIRLTGSASLVSGFLEASNVDAVHEMVDILGAQRAFETAQKTLGALDDVRAKDASDVARVKA